MEKHTPRTSSPNFKPGTAMRPAWWSDEHTSSWDRVKEALRRDWEQTKADLSSAGRDLNQNLVDTVKQAAGSQPLPAPTMKTRPDTPEQVAARIEDNIKARGKARERLAEAQTKAEVERVRAEGKVAQAEYDAQTKIADEQKKIAEARSDADEKIADARIEAQEKINKAQEKVSDAARDWGRAEPALRYGYGARMRYADSSAWDDQLESRLRGEWDELKSGSTWDEARQNVRLGWDYAARNRVV